MKKVLNVILIILFLSIAVNIKIVKAQENFGIKIEPFEEPSLAKPISVKIIFINSFDNWIKLQNPQGRLTIEYSGPGEKISTPEIFVNLPEDIRIPPNDKRVIDFPLDEFNKRSLTGRVGDWKINFKILYGWNGTKCYSKDTFKEFDCPSLNKEFVANPISFSIKAEEPEVGSDPKKILNSIWKFINENPVVSLIIGTVIAGLILLVSERKWKKSRR